MIPLAQRELTTKGIQIMNTQIFNLEMAIVRLNGEIFDAVNDNQPQTALYLSHKVDSIEAEIAAISSFNPLFQ